MRSDTQLHRDVVDELRWEPRVRDAEIGVSVKDGVVTLTGRVATFAQKHAAARVVERIAGVRAVADDLQVEIPGSLQRSDTEIAHAAIPTGEAGVLVGRFEKRQRARLRACVQVTGTAGQAAA